MDSKVVPARVGSLDTLRGVAMLLVILTHTATRFATSVPFRTGCAIIGNLGVQLFFIVSAYTMCMMWHGRQSEPDRLAKFYIRRICRIAVPYWFAIILYLHWPERPANVETLPSILANATFVHGLFPQYINVVVPGGWSIADEVNFYLVFPLLMKLQPVRMLVCGLAWYLLIELGLGSYLMDQAKVSDGFVFLSLCTQLPVFLMGMASYAIGRHHAIDVGRMAVLAIAWMGIAFFARHHGLAGRPMFWLEITGLAAAVWLVVHFGGHLRVLSFIGRRSYSMYLLHFYVLWLLARYLPAHTPWIAGFIATVALAALAATIGQKTVESWGQALGQWLIARLPAQVEPQSSAVGQVL